MLYHGHGLCDNIQHLANEKKLHMARAPRDVSAGKPTGRNTNKQESRQIIWRSLSGVQFPCAIKQ